MSFKMWGCMWGCVILGFLMGWVGKGMIVPGDDE